MDWRDDECLSLFIHTQGTWRNAGHAPYHSIPACSYPPDYKGPAARLVDEWPAGWIACRAAREYACKNMLVSSCSGVLVICNTRAMPSSFSQEGKAVH